MSDGSIDKHKAKLVGKGFSQLEGVDSEEIFSFVVKETTIWALLLVVVYLAH